MDEKERVFYITKPNRKLKHSIPPPSHTPRPPYPMYLPDIPLPHKLKTYNKTDAVRLALWMCRNVKTKQINNNKKQVLGFSKCPHTQKKKNTHTHTHMSLHLQHMHTCTYIHKNTHAPISIIPQFNTTFYL